MRRVDLGGRFVYDRGCRFLLRRINRYVIRGAQKSSLPPESHSS